MRGWGKRLSSKEKVGRRGRGEAIKGGRAAAGLWKAAESPRTFTTSSSRIRHLLSAYGNSLQRIPSDRVRSTAGARLVSFYGLPVLALTVSSACKANIHTATYIRRLQHHIQTLTATHSPFDTSGYTSNRLCVITGIPARASSNTFGSGVHSQSGSLECTRVQCLQMCV